MYHHHVAHLDAFAVGVRVGLKFKQGDLLGYCGKTGTGSPHCHYEIMRGKPERWTQYVWGLTKEEVEARYINPYQYAIKERNLPMAWNSIGNDFLTPIKDGGRNGFHPGVDLNWGSGSDDYRFEIRATTDGIIVYEGENPNDGAWGNHLWWKEESDLAQIYENYLIHDTQTSGSFALVYKGKKHVIIEDRAGLASLTVQARSMPFQALTKTEWDLIPSGDNF